jgi:hypothetical protein
MRAEIELLELKHQVTADSFVVVSKEQLSCDLSGEAAILDLKSGVYYGLNELGAFIWNNIREPRRVSQVKDAILEEYEVEPSRCERDLLRLLTQLAAKGLIEVSDEANS